MDDVFEKYAQHVFKLCFVYTKSKEDAEDLTQITFLKYLKSKPIFESEAHERNWLMKVAVNGCKNFLLTYWQKNTVSIDNLTELSVDDTYSSEILLDVFQLPQKYRTALYLYYYEGYSIAEIAKMQGTKESTIANRLSRARKKLKLEMEEICDE